jgi:hypothetical protein
MYDEMEAPTYEEYKKRRAARLAREAAIERGEAVTRFDRAVRALGITVIQINVISSNGSVRLVRP